MPRYRSICWGCLTAGVLLFPRLGVCAEPESLPKTWTVEHIKEFSKDGWGEAGRDGGKAFRAAQPKKRPYLRVPNWWGGTVRPPQGSRYVLEITYQDTVKEPVRVHAFNAIESYNEASELHRIGGEADGKWKVAHVPVSWDLILLPKGLQDAQLEFRVTGETELPIAQLKVRKAKLPKDQIRYEAESRAWVAKAQAEKAKSAKFVTPDQKAEIPAAWQNQALVPYVRPYYLNVHPNSAPKHEEVGAPVRIRMAQNEFEPGAFAVFAQEDLEGLTFKVSELRSSTGKLACEMKAYTVEFALVTAGRTGKAPLWSSQRLWNMYPARIPKGRSGWFYLTVHTLGKEKSRPGLYHGQIEIKAGKHRCKLPLEVEVLPITLLTMEEAGLRMGGCCTGLLTAGEMKSMREHNHNMINIWFAGVQPEMQKVGDKVELDFYYLDDFMKLAKANGQHAMVWFLGGNPPAYPNTLTVERELYRVMYGSKEPYFQKQGTPEQRGKIQEEVRPHYKKLIQDIVAHAKQAGWPELFFTPFDEPAKWAYADPRAAATKYSIGCGPWTRDHFKAACALLHEAAPENKVYLSLHHNNYREVHGTKGRVGEIFFPDVDIVCTNAVDEDNEMPQKVHKLGKEFWQYRMPFQGRFGFGFYFAAWESTGSLCWAYNWGPRLDISNAPNWMYAWYSPFETILTPTYEEIREGWDDRRYLATAKAAAKQAGVDFGPLFEALKKDIFANEFTGGGGHDLVNDFWTAGKDPRKMDEWRKSLVDQILAWTAK